MLYSCTHKATVGVKELTHAETNGIIMLKTVGHARLYSKPIVLTVTYYFIKVLNDGHFRAVTQEFLNVCCICKCKFIYYYVLGGLFVSDSIYE